MLLNDEGIRYPKGIISRWDWKGWLEPSFEKPYMSYQELLPFLLNRKQLKESLNHICILENSFWWQ